MFLHPASAHPRPALLHRGRQVLDGGSVRARVALNGVAAVSTHERAPVAQPSFSVGAAAAAARRRAGFVARGRRGTTDVRAVDRLACVGAGIARDAAIVGHGFEAAPLAHVESTVDWERLAVSAAAAAAASSAADAANWRQRTTRSRTRVLGRRGTRSLPRFVAFTTASGGDEEAQHH